MRPEPFVTAALLLTAAALGRPMPAQGPQILLRYHPRVGSQIVMHSDATITEVSVQAGTKDTERSVVKMSLITARRVLRDEAGRLRVQVSVDSVRGTMDAAGVHRDIPAQPRQWAEMLVDSLARAIPAAGQAVSRVDSLKQIGTWQRQPGEDLAFPVAAVQAGTRWSVTKTHDIADLGFANLPPGMTVPPLNEHVDAVVDSVVPRGTDTLAFVSVSTRLDPVTIPMTMPGIQMTMTMKGGETETQIWSTGWQGWVAAGSRARFDIGLKVTDKDGKTEGGTIAMDMVQSGRLRN
jgi:hypothetical protein